jgi:hypothetical protein
MLETLQTLRARNRRIVNEPCFARVNRRLSSHKKSVMRTARREGIWRRISQSARKIRQDTEHWKPKHRQFGSLAAGIRLAHQRGRKAMARARTSQRAADFHAWRKQMKALCYELRLVEGSSRRIRGDVNALHRAEEWLGNEHNVDVLCDQLSKAVPEGENRIDLDRVRLAGDRYQCELRTKALASSKRIYARAPGQYADAVRREWRRRHTAT